MEFKNYFLNYSGIWILILNGQFIVNFVSILIYMNKILFFILLVCIFSCSAKTGSNIPVDEPADNPLGWVDEDTYTVKVEALNEPEAIDRARHKILKDIVNVRVYSQSKYTDISKISVEFKKPLEEGKVIKRARVPGGIIIHYRIVDKGLKKKFERK